MITRIPQPQFQGPAPADVQIQAGNQGLRLADLFQQGIQEGAKNYLAQQQIDTEKEKTKVAAAGVEAEKQKTASESERLRLGLLAQDLQNDLVKNGPMSYVDRKSEWLQLFGFLAQGDKGLAQSMYEGGAGALNRMSATEMLKSGLIGAAPQGAQAAPAAAPAGIPLTSPLAPFAGAPAPAQVAPPVAPAAPVTPVTPAYPVPDYLQGRPMSSGQAPAPASAPPAAAAQASSDTIKITSVTEGLPKNAVTDAANSGLSKIAAMAAGSVDPTTSVTPKEQAAITTAMKPTIQVLKNAEVTKFLAAGGKQEALDAAAAQLNEALKDPQFADWINTARVMTKTEADDFNKSVAEDTKMQQLAAKIQRDYQLQSKENATIAANAYANMLRFQLAKQRLELQAANTKDNQTKIDLQKYTIVERSVKDYNTVLDNLRDQYMKGHPNSTEEEQNNFINSELLRGNSGARAALTTAANLYSALLGMSEADSEIQLKAQYFMGIPFLPETKPAQGGTVPTIPRGGAVPTPPAATPSAPATPKPATPAAPQAKSKALSDYLQQAGIQ